MSPPRRVKRIEEPVEVLPEVEPEEAPTLEAEDEAEAESPRSASSDRAPAYSELVVKTPPELREIGQALGIEDVQSLKKHDLLMNIVLNARGDDDGLQRRYGILDVLPDNRGYLRASSYTSDL
ncbi:MAG: hypothetical protein FJX74_16445, partial [Armatimonadetes bacterium]|nr:hypothetical protein [Armatimonadota bacterium]